MTKAQDDSVVSASTHSTNVPSAEFLIVDSSSSPDFAREIKEDLAHLDPLKFEEKYSVEAPSDRQWYVHSDDSFESPTDSPELVRDLAGRVGRVSESDWTYVDEIVSGAVSTVCEIHKALDSLSAPVGETPR